MLPRRHRKRQKKPRAKKVQKARKAPKEDKKQEKRRTGPDRNRSNQEDPAVKAAKKPVIVLLEAKTPKLRRRI